MVSSHVTTFWSPDSSTGSVKKVKHTNDNLDMAREWNSLSESVDEIGVQMSVSCY